MAASLARFITVLSIVISVSGDLIAVPSGTQPPTTSSNNYNGDKNFLNLGTAPGKLLGVDGGVGRPRGRLPDQRSRIGAPRDGRPRLPQALRPESGNSEILTRKSDL